MQERTHLGHILRSTDNYCCYGYVVMADTVDSIDYDHQYDQTKRMIVIIHASWPTGEQVYTTVI